MARIALVIAAILLAIGAATFTSTRTTAADEDMVSTLYPGVNLVGWVEEAAPVEHLFADIPRLDTVFAWDSSKQRWLFASPHVGTGTLRTLVPGMGLRLALAGEEPIEWRRSRGAYTDQTPLRPGWNLVAWQGLDRVPSPVALRQVRRAVTVAIAWDARQAQWLRAEPSEPTDSWTILELSHGDALWLHAESSVEWRQLTGERPRFLWVGEPSEQAQTKATNDLQSIRERYAKTFGGVTSGFDVLVSDSRATSRDWQRRATGRGRSSSACGYYGAHISYTIECGVHVLAHEYFHALQWAAQGERQVLVRPPVWLVEGSAQYAAYLQSDLSSPGTFERRMRLVWEHVRSHNRPLTDQRRDTRYVSGTAATVLLVDRAGTGSILEFFNRSADAQNQAEADDVFREVFGITVDEFTDQFERARNSPPPTHTPPTSEATQLWTQEPAHRLTVEFVGPDGSHISEYATTGLQPAWRGTRLIIAGLLFAAVSPGEYWIDHLTIDECQIRPTDEEGHAAPVSVSRRLDADVLQVRLSSIGCDSVISGSIRGPDGRLLEAQHSAIWVEAYEEPLVSRTPTAQVISASGPSFSMKVKPGRYSIGVSPIESGNARYGWFTPEMVVRDGAARTIIEVDSGETATVELILPFSRRIEISGTVLDSDGQPVSGARVAPRGPSADDPGNPLLRLGWVGWAETTATNGEFGVPFSGAFVGLLVTIGECQAGWYGTDGFVAGGTKQTYIETMSTDIAGIIIRLPEGTCR